jgi:hypothetical protein
MQNGKSKEHRQNPHLLVSNKREERVAGQPGYGDAAARASAAADEQLDHAPDLLRLALLLAPILDVDLLPAVGAGDHPPPRLAHPRQDGEHLLQRQVAEDEPQRVRE